MPAPIVIEDEVVLVFPVPILIDLNLVPQYMPLF
jgi:hypothetical protein